MNIDLHKLTCVAPHNWSLRHSGLGVIFFTMVLKVEIVGFQIGRVRFVVWIDACFWCQCCKLRIWHDLILQFRTLSYFRPPMSRVLHWLDWHFQILFSNPIKTLHKFGLLTIGCKTILQTSSNFATLLLLLSFRNATNLEREPIFKCPCFEIVSTNTWRCFVRSGSVICLLT